jgi:hypothetical protein
VAGAAHVDLREADARGNRQLRRPRRELVVGGDLVPFQAPGGERHHVRQMAPDDDVAPREAQPAGLGCERRLVAAVLADERPSRASRPTAAGSVRSTPASIAAW